jgi:hypothetical protein
MPKLKRVLKFTRIAWESLLRYSRIFHVQLRVRLDKLAGVLSTLNFECMQELRYFTLLTVHEQLCSKLTSPYASIEGILEDLDGKKCNIDGLRNKKIKHTPQQNWLSPIITSVIKAYFDLFFL